MHISGRVATSLGGAALVLVAWTGWRAMTIAGSSPSTELAVVLLDVPRVAGGAELRWEDETVQVRMGAGSRSMKIGDRLPVGDAVLELTSERARGRTVLRRAWSVFAHPTRGYHRIDFGPDPRGKRDGVRDRVLLPGDGPGFHLVPERDERDARFRPEDRGAIVVSEGDGLVVDHGGARVVLAKGQKVTVGERFVVTIDDLSLEVSWEDEARAAAVVDGKGDVVGYRSGRGRAFVVRQLNPRKVPRLRVQDEDGRFLASLGPGDGQVLLHGTADRLGPLRGGLLPRRAANLQLEAAVALGLEEGWIDIGRLSTDVQVPSGDGEDPDLGWPLARSVTRLMESYDRARLPAALRLGRGLVPARGTCEGPRGPTSLGWDAELDAWVPADRSGAGRVTLCSLPGQGEVEIEVGLPAAWRTEGRDWTPLPTTPGQWTRHTLEVRDRMEIRLDARPAEQGPHRVAAWVAGGPAGTTLGDTPRLAGRAFGGWDSAEAQAEEAAAAVWGALDGDRWRVEGIAPAPRVGAERPVFLRVPVQARTAGLIALDVVVPGRVVSATWNGEPVASGAFNRAREGGVSRLSLRSRPGGNLLAVHTLRPATAPVYAAGGTAFVPGDDGAPVALAERVVDRNARAAVLGLEPDEGVAPNAGVAPALRVERGDGDLDVGDRLRLAAAAGRSGWRTLETSVGPIHLRADPTGDVEVIASGGTLWSPSGVPTVLPLHPEGAAPLWTSWPRGQRLVIAGSPLRLLFPDVPTGYRTAVPAVAGPARLSLDDDLQEDAQAVLDAHLDGLPRVGVPDSHPLRGAVVALDALTGEVLACVGRDRLGDVAPEACWTDGDLRPGSVFKPLVAMAALGSVDPTVRRMLDGDLPAGLRRAASSGSLIDARLPALPRGSRSDLRLHTRLQNFRGRATPTDRALEGALRTSDNVWFGYLGLLLHEPLREGWLGTGIADDDRREAAWPVYTLARHAGFDSRLDLGFGVTGWAGRMPALAPDSDAHLAARVVGQDDVRATPLGIAGVLAAIATDGSRPEPTLVPGGVAAPRVRLVSRAGAARLEGALRDVVMKGTAAAAFADNPYRASILGKTGSSERIDAQGLPRTDSWFGGVVMPPSSTSGGPVVIVAVLPGAGLGGAHAGAVVDAISRAVVEARGWAPGAPATES